MSAMSAPGTLRAAGEQPAPSQELHALHLQLDQLELLLDEREGHGPDSLLGEVLRLVEIEVDALSAQYDPPAVVERAPTASKPSPIRKKK